MTYERELEWNEPPSLSELRYARWTVVRAAGLPSPSWWPLALLGAVHLYLAPPGSEGDAPILSAAPVVAAKRGRRGSGDYPGVDGEVQTGVYAPGAPPSAPPPPPARPHPLPRFVIDGDAIRVAVVDVSFDDLAALPAPAEGPFLVGLPGDETAGAPVLGPGHGTQMAGVVMAECPGARVGLFQIAGAAGAARPYLATADLAAAVAAAVEGWRADVVLIAMSEGAWGTPPYLRDVLREAARRGRDGRGAPIFCSVGDPSRNHARQDDSAALAADDLASQPWVQAIAACDRAGRWYRVYPGYDCPGANAVPGGRLEAPGATYNRLGPAVALAALGEAKRWSARIAADDSSQATAVAAAAAARVLDANRALSAAELRALMALTADVPADVDGGRGLAADVFDARDRLGHSFKIGHGVVNAAAGCLAAADPLCLALLATRPVPDAAISGPSPTARAVARAWRGAVVRAARRGRPAARDYLAVAARTSRLFLTALPVQEALCWLARHVRALTESASIDLWSLQDHGALVERIRHALDTVRESVGADETETIDQLDRLEAAILVPETNVTVGNALARAFRPDVMGPDGGQGEPRALALTSDAFGDHHRRRRAHRADGGGELERAAFARAPVSGPVHRSPR